MAGPPSPLLELDPFPATAASKPVVRSIDQTTMWAKSATYRVEPLMASPVGCCGMVVATPDGGPPPANVLIEPGVAVVAMT